MQIIFYRAPSGQEPVREYLSGLPLRDRAAAAVVITGPMMVLLHSYKKQSQKAPAREIKIAERRMKEVLHES